MKKRTETAISPGRHAAECKICAHPQRDEIERDFITWRSPRAIAKQYGLRNRASVYRHAHALALFAKRQRNVRAALEKINLSCDRKMANRKLKTGIEELERRQLAAPTSATRFLRWDFAEALEVACKQLMLPVESAWMAAEAAGLGCRKKEPQSARASA